MLPRVDNVTVAERRLIEARERGHAAYHRDDWDEVLAAGDEELAAERELALLRGDQHAEPVDLGVTWDVGAPMPHVVSGSGRTFLVFHLADPAWDGTDVAVADPGEDSPAGVGLVEFRNVHEVRFGGPNDEALKGHSLYGKGLRPYQAHVVRGSKWIASAEEANSVHPYHRGGWHERLNHYVLCFHDETFECLAEDVRAEGLTTSLAQAIELASNRLLSAATTHVPGPRVSGAPELRRTAADSHVGE